jgi:uncharacterized cysteine cluster protein YcgN (CxxCxxCC family)
MNYLEDFILTQMKKRGLVRVGKCHGCGKCCIGGVKIYHCKEETIEIKEIKKIQCIHYDEQSKTCKKYNERTAWCSLFPYLPEVQFEGCGYRFEKINTQETK